MRIIVKVGTHLLTDGGLRLSRDRMVDLAAQVASLREEGHEAVLVTSGAVFAGREVLGPPPRRKDIPFKQVLAAVGQVRLMEIYREIFAGHGLTVAQALLTRGDLADRERYLNARKTLLSLLRMKVLPVINENDVVAIDEIRIGDNDNLSAMVANLLDADLLVILTDQEGLFTADPRLHPGARLIPEVERIDSRIRALAGDTRTQTGTGGMATKIEAAETATRFGCEVVIAGGRGPKVLKRIVGGESVGTRFKARLTRVEARKRWILAESPRGTIRIDEGAARALLEQGKSLLAVGICGLDGEFDRGHTVRVQDSDGREIGRGITNYDSSDLQAIQGVRSTEIAAVLGYQYGPTVIHRDDLVLFSREPVAQSEGECP